MKQNAHKNLMQSLMGFILVLSATIQNQERNSLIVQPRQRADMRLKNDFT